MSGLGDDDLHELCDAAAEGRLTADQAERLERLVLSDPTALRLYVEYLHQHACLHWSAADPAFMAARPDAEAPDRAPAVTPIDGARRSSWRWVRRAGWLSAAAALVLGVWLGARSRPPAEVATLAGVKACKWDGGSVPTEIGAKLPAGRLRLAEGLARIAFACGAEVTLEGPAELELVTPKRCVLHAGRLVAKVPDEAVGFTVDTPTALIEDLGTEFGVNVRQGKSSDVQVFDGRVDVRHVPTGRVEKMRTGVNLRFAPSGVSVFDPLAERPMVAAAVGTADRSARTMQVTTATGAGKDTYIRPPLPLGDGPYPLLLVKNCPNSDWCRKAYLGLDLTPAAGATVVDARLSLTLAPSNLGFAAEVGDCTFAVYGLTDESRDGWDSRTMVWNNAPANRPGGVDLDPAKVMLLGKFQVMQGVQTGTREVSGPALVDFLNRDTNGTATFIIIRETMGSGRLDLVHAFAGRYHPELSPPTLKLTVVPRRR